MSKWADHIQTTLSYCLSSLGLRTLVLGTLLSCTCLSSSVAMPKKIRMFVSATCSKKRGRGTSNFSLHLSSLIKSLKWISSFVQSFIFYIFANIWSCFSYRAAFSSLVLALASLLLLLSSMRWYFSCAASTGVNPKSFCIFKKLGVTADSKN